MVAIPGNVPDQERLVEAYLDEHPFSTVVQIRDGVEAESGVKIERVQARIDRIGRRRQVRKGTGDYGRTTYALGGVRQVIRAGGIEARILVVDGKVVLEVRQQGDDGVLDPEVRAIIGRSRTALEAAWSSKVVPVVEKAAADMGLLGGTAGAPDDDWLTTLSKYQDEED